MSDVKTWDMEAAGNSSAVPDGWPEDVMQASDVNDAAREMMAALARYFEVDGANKTTTGTSSAYVLTFDESGTVAEGRPVAFTPHVTNVANPTLNINGAGAFSIVTLDGDNIAAGVLVVNQSYRCYRSGSTYVLYAVADAQDASATDKGVVELATDAETQAGTDATRAVTPAGLASRTATTSRTGLVELALNSEVQAGLDSARAITPAGLASRTATDGRAGIVELATDDETQAGVDSARAITPSSLVSRTATADRAGLIELATAAEVTAGTDTQRAVTPATLAGLGYHGDGLTQSEVDARVQAGVEDWAEAGNTDDIPTSKLPTAATEGLNQSEVDARVAAGVADWAEQGNTADIPTSKLPTAATEGLNQTEVDARVTTLRPSTRQAPDPSSAVDGQVVKVQSGSYVLAADEVGEAGTGEANPEAATQGEAEAGTVTALRSWSPARVRQAIEALGGSGSGHIYLGTGSVSDDANRILTLDGTTDPSDGDIVVFMMGSDNLPSSNPGDVGSVAHNGNTYTIVRTSGNGLHTKSLDRTSVYIGRLDGTVIRLPGDVNIPILATEAQATGGTHAFGRIYSAALIRAAIDARVPQDRVLPDPGSGNENKIAKINSSDEWVLADDASGAGGTTDYDDLTDKPVIRVASVSDIPDPSVSNVGTRYQDTSTGRQYVSVGIPQHGTDRVVNLSPVPTVAGNTVGYRGAVGVYYDLPGPSTLPHGAFYLVRYDAYHSTTAFRQVTSQGGWERIATWPGSGTYRGAYLNQEEAEANVEAAGDIVVLGTTEANSQVYSVDSDFVAGTPASTEYELRAVDAFHVSDADDPLVASDVRDWALESSGDLVPRNRLSLGSMSENEARSGTAANERIVSALRLAQAAKGTIDRDHGIAQAVQDIQSLQVLTEDLQVETQKAWVTVPNATGAAMHVGNLGSNPPTTATAAAALSYVATFDIPTTYHDGHSGSSLTPIVIRIPVADDQNDYRLVQVHNSESRSISHFWLSIGSDDTYHYYYSSPILFSGYQLRLQNNTNTVVGTEYHGDVSHATGLPAAVPSGGTDGQLLSRDGTSGLDWVDAPTGGGGSSGSSAGELVELHNDGSAVTRSSDTWYEFNIARALTEADDNKLLVFTFRESITYSETEYNERAVKIVRARELRTMPTAPDDDVIIQSIRFIVSGISTSGETTETFFVYFNKKSETVWRIRTNSGAHLGWFSVDLLTPAGTSGGSGLTEAEVDARVTTLRPANRQIPSGGTDNQILAKSADTDYATEWIDAPAGGGSTGSAAGERVQLHNEGQPPNPQRNNHTWYTFNVARALAEADDNKAVLFTFHNQTRGTQVQQWVHARTMRLLTSVATSLNNTTNTIRFRFSELDHSGLSDVGSTSVYVRRHSGTQWGILVNNTDQVEWFSVDLITPAGVSGGSGLTEAQVDARVAAGVLDWAEAGNDDTIPDSKLPSAAAPEVMYEDTSDVDSPAYNHVGWTPFQLSRALTSADDNKTLRFSFRGRNESTNRRHSGYFYVSAKTFRELPEHSTNPSSRQDTLYMTVSRLYEDGLSSFGVCRIIFSHVVGGRNYRLSVSHSNSFFRMKIELVKPSSGGSGGTGLSQSEVDARVQAGVLDWAEQGNSDTIPESKLPTAATEGLNQSEVDARVTAGVEDWAEAGNTSDVPVSKLPTAATEGLNQSEVDARVAAGVLDWAEAGNTDVVPDAKLPTAATEGLNQSEVDARVTSLRPANRQIPSGGTDNQILAKSADTDYATEWVDAPSGGGGTTAADEVVDLGTGDIAAAMTLDGTSTPADGDVVFFTTSSTARPSSAANITSITVNGNTYTFRRRDNAGVSTDALHPQSVYFGVLDGTVIRSPGSTALPIDVTQAQAEGGTHQYSRLWSALRVRQAINAGVENWAEAGNTDDIPASKLPTAATEGLNQSEVDARVTSLRPANRQIPSGGTDNQILAKSADTDYATEWVDAPTGGTANAATESAAGVIELATSAEVQAGTDAVRAVTPLGLASLTATTERAGIAEFATDAEAGSSAYSDKMVSPGSLNSVVGSVATAAEIEAGTDTNVHRYSPKTLRDAIRRHDFNATLLLNFDFSSLTAFTETNWWPTTEGGAAIFYPVIPTTGIGVVQICESDSGANGGWIGGAQFFRWEDIAALDPIADAHTAPFTSTGHEVACGFRWVSINNAVTSIAKTTLIFGKQRVDTDAEGAFRLRIAANTNSQPIPSPLLLWLMREGPD